MIFSIRNEVFIRHRSYHISFLQRKSGIEHEILIRRIRNYSPDDFAFSIISFHEQIIGAHTYIIRSQNSENLYKGYRLLQ